MSARKMIPFLLLNVVVSTVVVLAILYWWDNRDGSETAVVIMTSGDYRLEQETMAAGAQAPAAKARAMRSHPGAAPQRSPSPRPAPRSTKTTAHRR